jgi:hypothetical protein
MTKVKEIPLDYNFSARSLKNYHLFTVVSSRINCQVTLDLNGEFFYHYTCLLVIFNVFEKPDIIIFLYAFLKTVLYLLAKNGSSFEFYF